MGLKLNSTYITIPVSSFNNSVDWYKEHFGFKVITEDPNYIELQNESGIKILFQQDEHNLNSHFIYPNGAAQSSYGFMVNDAEVHIGTAWIKGLKLENF